MRRGRGRWLRALGLVPQGLRKVLLPVGVAEAQTTAPIPTSTLPARTAGSSLPASPAISSDSRRYHPDNLAPAPFTTYIFGFRNVTG